MNLPKKDDHADNFAFRLLRLRSRANLSVTALAAAAGLSRQQIGNYEAGRAEPGLAALARLAGALGCTTDDLTPGRPMISEE